MSNWTLIVVIIVLVGLNIAFTLRWIAAFEKRLNEIEKQRGIDQDDPKLMRRSSWTP